MKIVMNVIKSVFCLALIAGTVYLAVGGVIMATGGGGIEGDPVIEIGNIGKEPVSLFSDVLDDKTDDVQEVVDSYDLTDIDEIKSAIIDLYVIGCETWYNAPARGARYLGDGTGGIYGELEGKLKVFNERYYVKGDATDDNPYPYYGIEEKHNYAYDVNKPEPIASIAAQTLGSARRFLYMPTGDWSWEGEKNSSTLNTEGAKASFTKSPEYKSAAEVKKAKEDEELASHLGSGSAYYYYGDEIPDKSTYVLYEPEAILDASDENGFAPKLTESKIDGKTVWTAEFAVNCDVNKAYTKYAAHAIGKTIDSVVNVVYKKLTIKFELWETGYFRSWSATERWEGDSTNALYKDKTGFAEVASTEIYTYDIDEVTKVISEKAAIVLKADPAKPDVSSVVKVTYNGKEVFK